MAPPVRQIPNGRHRSKSPLGVSSVSYRGAKNNLMLRYPPSNQSYSEYRPQRGSQRGNAVGSRRDYEDIHRRIPNPRFDQVSPQWSSRDRSLINRNRDFPRDMPPRNLNRDIHSRNLNRDIPPRGLPRDIPPRTLPRNMPPRNSPRDMPQRDTPRRYERENFEQEVSKRRRDGNLSQSFSRGISSELLQSSRRVYETPRVPVDARVFSPAKPRRYNENFEKPVKWQDDRGDQSIRNGRSSFNERRTSRPYQEESTTEFPKRSRPDFRRDTVQEERIPTFNGRPQGLMRGSLRGRYQSGRR